MKVGTWQSAIVIVCAACFLTLDTRAQAPADTGTPIATTSATASQTVTNVSMVSAQVWLDKSLDAKKARQGDAVTAKLQQDVKAGDGRQLPRGALIEGHLDQVQASESKSDSTVVMTFDKIRLKSGEEMPIKATVVAIAAPVSMQAAGQPGDAMTSGTGVMPGQSAGANGGHTSGPMNTGSLPLSQGTSSEGGQDQAGQLSMQHPNGVPGVVLKSDVHDKSSATFTARGRNVHLADGTQMAVALAIIPAGAPAQ